MKETVRPHTPCILIVDDHPIVREGIKSLLASASPSPRILEAADGCEAMQTVNAVRVEIVVVDLEIPGIDGFQLMDHLARCPFPPRIVVYTMHEEPWTVVRLQEKKVDAIVLKGDNPMEIVTAVESVKAGLSYYSQRYVSLIEKSTPILTAREAEVLSLLSNGYSSRQVADLLFVSENTIEYHRKQIFRRLGARNNVHAVSIAMQRGLMPSFPKGDMR